MSPYVCDTASPAGTHTHTCLPRIGGIRLPTTNRQSRPVRDPTDSCKPRVHIQDAARPTGNEYFRVDRTREWSRFDKKFLTSYEKFSPSYPVTARSPVRGATQRVGRHGPHMDSLGDLNARGTREVRRTVRSQSRPSAPLRCRAGMPTLTPARSQDRPPTSLIVSNCATYFITTFPGHFLHATNNSDSLICSQNTFRLVRCQTR